MTCNLTLAIDEELLARFRLHAAEQRTTVNALVRRMMEEAVGAEARRKASIARMLELSDEAAAFDAAHEGSAAPLDLSRGDTYAERLSRWPRGK
jgi:hypothetical protein